MIPAELKDVGEIYRILREWERDFPTAPDDKLLAEMNERIRQLAESSEPSVQKLAPFAERFTPRLTAKELFDFIIPFERALHKQLRDDEFLVREKDQARPLNQKKYPLVLVLENLRSAFNVGAFFRLGEALGAQELVLTGYTATPENEKIRKTTMGTEAWLPWRQTESLVAALAEFKSAGYRIIAIETARDAKDIREDFAKSPSVFIFGNERFGLSREALKMADEIRRVPLAGQKNSLNVATCASICCFEWIRQWNL